MTLTVIGLKSRFKSKHQTTQNKAATKTFSPSKVSGKGKGIMGEDQDAAPKPKPQSTSFKVSTVPTVPLSDLAKTLAAAQFTSDDANKHADYLSHSLASPSSPLPLQVVYPPELIVQNQFEKLEGGLEGSELPSNATQPFLFIEDGDTKQSDDVIRISGNSPTRSLQSTNSMLKCFEKLEMENLDMSTASNASDSIKRRGKNDDTGFSMLGSKEVQN